MPVKEHVPCEYDFESTLSLVCLVHKRGPFVHRVVLAVPWWRQTLREMKDLGLLRGKALEHAERLEDPNNMAGVGDAG